MKKYSAKKPLFIAVVSVGMMWVLTGCGGPKSRAHTAVPMTPTGQVIRSDQCRFDPQSCIYKGSYEPNERAYAEQKAKDLNRAAAERLRRSTGR